jgi:glycosyltransferase involved in cell wall biosynthesis
MKITACIITLNEERDLPRCLESIAPLVDEILIVDSGSTDATEDIARHFNARFRRQEWLGYVGQKNFSLDQATHPWVLSIDADEEISPELAASIAQLKAHPDAESPDAPNGYEMSRVVFYCNRWIRHGDWYPDRLVRLFRRDQARFAGGRVHERLEISGPHPLLSGDLRHFTYGSAADREERCAKYAALWAQTAHEENRRAGPLAPFTHAIARFCKGYFLKRGFMDGFVGWDIAMGNAREVWLKYHLLRQLQSRP